MTHRVSLQDWFWRALFRSAIIPLLVIELSFLTVFWFSGRLSYDTNIDTVQQISHTYLEDIATREASTISETLRSVGNMTDVFALQTRNALLTPAVVDPAERARYAFDANGAFRTVRDNGTTASFYSGIEPITERSLDKVWRLQRLDPLMRDIKASNPLVTQVYFNTYDSYNRIYPYFDTSTYPARMDIPAYNFYYEADSAHNPKRKAVWTDAYIDPAGQGWMVSSIAPVYIDNRLEGVVGIDVTIRSIVDHLLATDLPWGSYAMLAGRDGTIIAIQPAGEKDLKIKELKDHSYSKAIETNTFKPGQFNLLKRDDTRALGQTVFDKERGYVHFKLHGEERIAAYAAVGGPDWHLIVVGAESQINQTAETLRDQYTRATVIMLVILVLFYLGYFAFLYVRSRRMSHVVAQPLEQLSGVVETMTRGGREPEFSGSEVEEIDKFGLHLIDVHRKLSAAEARSQAQEKLVAAALEKEREANETQRRFMRVMSHEIRTPLAVIDSSAQILERKATSLEPTALVERAHKMRRSTSRIAGLLTRLVRLLDIDSGKGKAPMVPVDLGQLVNHVCRDFADMGSGRTFNVVTEPDLVVLADPELMRLTLVAVLENAEKYSPAEKPIDVRAERKQNNAIITITDYGNGISEEDKPHIFDRFYRGSNATGTTGSGIGLHLASVFAATNRGEIRVADGEDGGTCVFLRFRLASATRKTKRTEEVTA
ncbi:Cache sensor signal transduction histidine kinase [Chakrabartia godavariana]|nr:Cache sensor signal transduction histidine kinase [Chakrabartia godavariana]